MSDTALTLEKVLEDAGWLARWEAQGKVKGKAEGKTPPKALTAASSLLDVPMGMGCMRRYSAAQRHPCGYLGEQHIEFGYPVGE